MMTNEQSTFYFIYFRDKESLVPHVETIPAKKITKTNEQFASEKNNS